MAKPRWHDEDDGLLAELGRALGTATEVPKAVMDAAKSVYTWRTVDAELAALAYDSAFDTDLLAFRGDFAPVRTLTFECDALVVELGVCGNGLVGELIPAQAGTIEVRTLRGRPISVPVDDLGCFRIRPAPSGPFSLHVLAERSVDVVTDWVTL